MRIVQNINKQWTFIKENVPYEKALSAKGDPIDLPHTWNGRDGQSGGNNYYRNTCWYIRKIARKEISPDSHVYLEFKGANSSVTVHFNGECLGKHEGGYSTFRFEITDLIADENTIAVAVDNSKNDRVYPQTADFTFYGGIYRDVNIISLSENHFSLSDAGSSGLYITPSVRGKTGHLSYRAEVKGSGILKATLFDRDGQIRGESSGEQPMEIENVHLWNGIKDPYLYSLTVQLLNDDEVVDQLEKKIGFRTFRVDPDRGFFLNGEKYPLRGVSRHQDRRDIGNALLKEHHDEDIEIIREVGANTIRLAHYQHNDYFYDLCDEYGFIVWAEIPYISRHMKKGNPNARQQMEELIKQQYNHASIYCWGISNEITMYPSGNDRLRFHREMQDFCHSLDSSRPTAIAGYVMKQNSNRLNRITDLVSYNLYYGWYFPFTRLSALKLDLFHRKYPETPVGLAEYGAEGMPDLHSSKPRRGDNTEEYQAIYHEKMIKIIEERDYLWGTHLWNMFDFAADARDQGGEPGMNHKGLVTFDRKIKKDSFFLYKAYWSEEPFIHICGKRFEKREGKRTRIKVYSNQGKVDLYLNGNLIESREGEKVFNFSIPLSNENYIRVKTSSLFDETRIIKVDKKEPSYTLKKTNTKNWQK